MAALAALVVGVEHEAGGVVALQQHHAAGGHAVLADRRQCHGGGVVGLSGLGFAMPGGEAVDWIGCLLRPDFHSTFPLFIPSLPNNTSAASNTYRRSTHKP